MLIECKTAFADSAGEATVCSVNLQDDEIGYAISDLLSRAYPGAPVLCSPKEVYGVSYKIAPELKTTTKTCQRNQLNSEPLNRGWPICCIKEPNKYPNHGQKL
jgi:hypothetical protein